MIQAYIVKLFTSPVGNWFSAGLITLLSFFTPIHLLLVATTFLILFDFITGIIASRKNKKKITSLKMYDTFVKWFLYVIFISVLYLIESAMFGGTTTLLSKLLFAFICLREVLSVCENCDKITGTNTFSLFWKKVKGIFLKFINK